MKAVSTNRACALTLLGFAYLVYAYISYRERWVLPLCVFRLLTGWLCPLCGLTRSVGATLNGQVTTALRFHVLGPAVVIANCWAAMQLLADHYNCNRANQRDQDCCSTSANKSPTLTRN